MRRLLRKDLGRTAARYGRWIVSSGTHPRTLRAGPGSAIHSPTRLQGLLTLGRGVVVFRGLDCVGPVSIGDHTFVGPHAYLRPGVRIGARVAIGPYVKLITDSHVLGSSRQRAGEPTNDPVTIGDGCWLGAGVTVLPGVSVGAGAVVAAGSVVTRDVEADTLVAGIPAREARRLD